MYHTMITINNMLLEKCKGGLDGPTVPKPNIAQIRKLSPLT